MSVPDNPKIYHIVHVDRLASILADGCLWSDSEVLKRKPDGTTIGMDHIKERRLKQNSLFSHSNLMVGDCVPFYFCPRSIMLYLIHRGNHPDLSFQGGQDQVIHLRADLQQTITWAESQGKRWAFTDSNAGSSYFNDFADLNQLDKINWQAVRATNWSASDTKEGKQAEFLTEEHFPWSMVEGIGVKSQATYQRVTEILANAGQQASVQILPAWYY